MTVTGQVPDGADAGGEQEQAEAAKMTWTIQSASRTPRAVPRAPASRAPSGIMP